MREWNSGGATKAGTKRGPNSTGVRTIRSLRKCVSFLDKSGREQAERRRLEEEQRNRELRQAQALASAKRRQSIVLALLLVGVGAIAVLFYRDVLKNQQITQATAEYQRLSTDSQAAQARLKDLEAQEASLKTQVAAAATPEEKARLEQLTREIEAAKGQAKGSQDELAKLKKDRELSDSDRGRLLKQVETLQQQLTQVTFGARRASNAETANPVDNVRRSSSAAAEAASGGAQSLGRGDRGDCQAETGPRRGYAQRDATVSSGASSATAQDLTRAFTDGVRAYDLGNWKASTQYMQEAIRMQSGVKQPPKEARISGNPIRSVCAVLIPRRGARRDEEPTARPCWWRSSKPKTNQSLRIYARSCRRRANSAPLRRNRSRSE